MKEINPSSVQLVLTFKDELGQPITVRTRIVVREEGSSDGRMYRAEGRAGEITRFLFELPPRLYLVHVQADGFEVYRQRISLLPYENSGMRRVLSERGSAREYILEAPYEFILTVKGESEDDIDVMRKRFDWFAQQRTYPLMHFPIDAREKALIIKRQMPGPGAGIFREAGILPGGPPEVPLSLRKTRPVVPGICNWTALGPRNINGRVRALAVQAHSPSPMIYAGSANAGVWLSSDGGQSWEALMHDEDALEIGALATHLTDPNNPAGDVTVYAGTGEATIHVGYKGIGILKSTQSGSLGTWSATGAFPAPGNNRISVILIDPTSVTADPTKTVVYAGGMNVTDEGIATPGGLYKSSDGGASWQLLLGKVITGLAMDPTNTGTLYAGVPGEGIYVYDPAAGSWQLFNTGLSAQSSTESQSIVLAISQADPSRIYAKIDEHVYVYDTAAAGPAWQDLGVHGSETNRDWSNVLAVDPQNADLVFAGGTTLERNFAGGAPGKWQFADVQHADQHAVVFDPTNSLNVYVANDGGVHYGTYEATDTSVWDVGVWTKVSNGLILTQFHQVGSSSIGPNVVGSGSQDTATGRTVGGLTWEPFLQDVGGGSDGSGLVIDPDPNNPYILYGAVNTSQQDGMIYKSANGGATFAPSSTGFPGGPWVTTIVLDPTSPLEPNRVLFAGGTSKVYRSTDSARSWTASSPLLKGPVTAIELAPSSSAVVYIGTGAGTAGTVWRSSDGGATVANWKDITVGSPQGVGLPSRSITHIAVHPTNPAIVYVTFSGINTSSIAINPPQAYHVFRGTGTDQWTTWTWENISSNLPDIPVNAIEIDRTAPDTTLYIGTDVGVFRTTNGGQLWENFGAGLPNVVITDLALNATGTILRAASYGYGMFELRLAATGPIVDIYIRDNKLDTGETFPSPSEVKDPAVANGLVHWWESPDIKVDSTIHSSLFDGVQFDQDTPGEVTQTGPQHPDPNHLYVQVHNRGPLPATNVKVKVLWTDAAAGLPLLPADFWASYPNDWTAASSWQTVNAQFPFQTIAQLLPHTPVVLEWEWAVPEAVANPCVLAVISADEDPVGHSDANPNDHLVSALVPNDKHLAINNLHVIAANRVNGQNTSPIVAHLDLHNPLPYPQYFDIAIERGMIPAENELSLLLPRSHVQPPVAYGQSKQLVISAITGQEEWWDRQGRLIKEEWGHRCHVRTDDNDEAVLQESARIQRILIPASGKIRTALIVSPPADAQPGSTYRFAIKQYLGDTLLGGSTYEIRIPPVEVYVNALEL